MMQPRPNPRSVGLHKNTPIVLTYTYSCSVCQEAAQQQFPMYFSGGSPLAPNPCPPEGWRVVDNKLICAKHKVEVVVITTEEVTRKWEL